MSNELNEILKHSKFIIIDKKYYDKIIPVEGLEELKNVK